MTSRVFRTLIVACAAVTAMSVAACSKKTDEGNVAAADAANAAAAADSAQNAAATANAAAADAASAAGNASAMTGNAPAGNM